MFHIQFVARLRSNISFFALLFAAPAATATPGYLIERIQLPGAYSTSLADINNNGIAVGYASTNPDVGVTVAVVYSGGVLTTFGGPPNAVSSDLDGITNDGTMFGNYSTTLVDDGAGNLVAGPSQIFSHKNGVFQTYAIPGLDSPYADAVSPSGRWIVGHYFDQQENIKPFIYDLASNTTTTLNRASAPTSIAAGINDLGKVVGYDRMPALGGGFLGSAWVYDISSGTYVDTSIQGAARSAARDISASGTISGYFGDSRFQSVHGFSGTGAQMHSIDVDGALVTGVLGANDNGVLVGFYRPALDGIQAGFISSPIPEPTTAALFLFGFAILASGALSRRAANAIASVHHAEASQETHLK